MTETTYGALRLRYQQHLIQRRRNSRIFWWTVALFILGCFLFGLAVAPRAASAAELVVESNIIVVGKDGVAKIGKSIRRYDFSGSEFGQFPEYATDDLNCIQPASKDPLVIAAVAQYIESFNRRMDGSTIAEKIVKGQRRYPAMPLDLLVPMIKLESSFNEHNRNRSSGAWGLPQLMPRFHRARLERMGLDWNDGQSQVEYACWHVQHDYEILVKRGVNPEKALYDACRWWTPLPAAWAEYQQRIKDGTVFEDPAKCD